MPIEFIGMWIVQHVHADAYIHQTEMVCRAIGKRNSRLLRLMIYIAVREAVMRKDAFQSNTSVFTRKQAYPTVAPPAGRIFAPAFVSLPPTK